MTYPAPTNKLCEIRVLHKDDKVLLLPYEHDLITNDDLFDHESGIVLVGSPEIVEHQIQLEDGMSLDDIMRRTYDYRTREPAFQSLVARDPDIHQKTELSSSSFVAGPIQATYRSKSIDTRIAVQSASYIKGGRNVIGQGTHAYAYDQETGSPIFEQPLEHAQAICELAVLQYIADFRSFFASREEIVQYQGADITTKGIPRSIFEELLLPELSRLIWFTQNTKLKKITGIMFGPLTIKLPKEPKRRTTYQLPVTLLGVNRD